MSRKLPWNHFEKLVTVLSVDELLCGHLFSRIDCFALQGGTPSNVSIVGCAVES